MKPLGRSGRAAMLVAVLAIVVGSGALLLAQEPPSGPMGPGQRPPRPGAGAPEPRAPFLVGEAEIVVAGAPYSADVVTETQHQLADGNRISRKFTAQVARDSSGRTRREQVLAGPAPLVASGEAPRVIVIRDPVAKVTWSLDPLQKTARRLPFGPPAPPRPPVPPAAIDEGAPPPPAPPAPPLPPAPPGVEGGAPRPPVPPDGTFEVPAPPPGEGRPGPMGRDVVTEKLGTRTIEGVEAEGTRTTVTIEAGAIGNEKPILIVSERWFSTELRAVVLATHSDPRNGETAYRLTNINRSEPAAELFVVPEGYQAIEGTARQPRK